MKLRAALKNPALWPWLIVVPGIILRLWNIATSPLWYDEAFTRLVVALPLDKLLSATAADVHPPAYYLMVQSWTLLLGNTPLTLRLFSAMWSIFSLSTLWAITGELGLSRSARLIALAFMAFHPSQIHYAQEARMYTLLQDLILIQTLCMLKGRWGWFGFYTTMSLYTHNYALIYTPVIVLVGMARELREYRKIPGALLVSAILPGLLWLPWAYRLYHQMAYVAQSYWIPPLTLGSSIHAVLQILEGFHMYPNLVMVTTFALAAGIALLVLQGVRLRLWSLLALAFAPLALVLIASLAWKPILLFRGLIGILPPLFVLAGVILARTDLRGRWVAYALILPLAACLVATLGANQNGQAKKTPLMLRPETSLPIFHLDDSTLILIGQPGKDYLLDLGCPGEGGALTHQTRLDLGFTILTKNELPKHYLFAGAITPLSTQCHEKVYREMAKAGRVVFESKTTLEEEGIFEYGR